jgi:hypothetical protein
MKVAHCVESPGHPDLPTQPLKIVVVNTIERPETPEETQKRLALAEEEKKKAGKKAPAGILNVEGGREGETDDGGDGDEVGEGGDSGQPDARDGAAEVLEVGDIADPVHQRPECSRRNGIINSHWR